MGIPGWHSHSHAGHSHAPSLLSCLQEPHSTKWTLPRQIGRSRFFINISAVDYLLLRVEELLEIISNVPGDANFVGAEHRRHLSLIFGRVTNVVLDEALFRSDPYWRVNATSPFRRLYPTLFRPYHGEAWMILSRRFCTYVTESTDGLPRRMFAYYANIISAPEGYFHTLICASEFASTLVADSLRYVDWSTPRQHPPDISSRHIPLLETKGAVFARKVVDFEVIAEIDERLRRTVPAGKHRSSITAAWVSQRIGRALLPENRGCDKVEVNQTEANFLGSGPFHGYDLSLLDDYPANPGVDNRGPNASDAYAFRGGQENFQSL